MNTVKMSGTQVERKGLLSALWIFLSVNYIYCDHLALLEPGRLNDLLAGQVGSIQVTQIFLLSAAVLMEIPFAMIVLSLVLKHRVNRWVNIGAGVTMAAVQIGTMGMGTPSTYAYLFYSAIEVAINLVIVWLAWKWKPAMNPLPSTDTSALANNVAR